MPRYSAEPTTNAVREAPSLLRQAIEIEFEPVSAGAVMTDAQRAALKWLREHNGYGVFGKDRVLVAAGERAPVCRSTWNKLRDLGAVEFYGGPKGRSRVRILAQLEGRS